LKVKLEAIVRDNVLKSRSIDVFDSSKDSIESINMFVRKANFILSELFNSSLI